LPKSVKSAPVPPSLSPLIDIDNDPNDKRWVLIYPTDPRDISPSDDIVIHTVSERLSFLVSAVKRRINGLLKTEFLRLAREAFPNDAPESVLKRLCDQGTLLEAGEYIIMR